MQNQQKQHQPKKQKKEFSVLKWIIFPSTSLILAAIIVWFNITVFGIQDGAPYIGIAAAITFFSICICKYTNSENRGLVIGAFCFEILLISALIINAAYSLSVQREMSIARQGATFRNEELDRIGKLDRRAQRNVTRQMNRTSSAEQIFGNNESMLFWIFVGEMIAYAVAAFSLFAIAQVVEKRQPQYVYINEEPRRYPRYDDMEDRWQQKSRPGFQPQTAKTDNDPKS